MPDTDTNASNQVTQPKPQMNLLKKYILFVLIGGLIVCAIISIISVLVGQFNDIAARSLGTTFSIVVHALVGLTFLSIKRPNSIASHIMLNSLFVAVIVSMLSSILGIWGVISGMVTLDMYGTIIIGLVASLIVSGVLTAHLEDKVTNALAIGSSLATVAAFALLLPWVFENNAYVLPEFYYRLIAALFILAATSIVLTIIFDRLYVTKHPHVAAAKTGMPIWAKFAIGFAVFITFGWIAIPLFFWIFGLY